MSYTQLSASERNQVYESRAEKSLSMRAIARQLGRDQSTISRELARNRSEGGHYLPGSVHQKMQTRRKHAKTAFSCVTEICIFEIKERLKQYHSPEQIAGRLKREGRARISHETIYQMIYRAK